MTVVSTVLNNILVVVVVIIAFVVVAPSTTTTTTTNSSSNSIKPDEKILSCSNLKTYANDINHEQTKYVQSDNDELTHLHSRQSKNFSHSSSIKFHCICDAGESVIKRGSIPLVEQQSHNFSWSCSIPY